MTVVYNDRRTRNPCGTGDGRDALYYIDEDARARAFRRCVQGGYFIRSAILARASTGAFLVELAARRAADTSTDAPRINSAERVTLVPVGVGITRVTLHFGFMEHLHVMDGLRVACRDPLNDNRSGMEPQG
jgi:hypothetical protein